MRRPWPIQGRESAQARNITMIRMGATSWRPETAAAPTAPVAHKLSAVAVPDVRRARWRTSPPPMKPTPVAKPSMMLAGLPGSIPTARMATHTKPQAAMEPRGKVRIPAERAFRSRSHPIGIAGANEGRMRWEATDRAFVWNGVMARTGMRRRDEKGAWSRWAAPGGPAGASSDLLEPR